MKIGTEKNQQHTPCIKKDYKFIKLHLPQLQQI